jgi:hypothetical protein
VDIDARVLKAGGAVAIMSCALRARASGRAVAEGRHTKYLPRTEVGPQLERMLRGASAGAAPPARPVAKL